MKLRLERVIFSLFFFYVSWYITKRFSLLSKRIHFNTFQSNDQAVNDYWLSNIYNKIIAIKPRIAFENEILISCRKLLNLQWLSSFKKFEVEYFVSSHGVI